MPDRAAPKGGPIGNERKLSIVTVSYNDPDGLAATIRSLEPLQTAGLDWEHVVVDSSPKLNGTLIAEARGRGWPLQYLTPLPEGIYAAQNTGLAAARGQTLWFLNGGDRLKDLSALGAALRELSDDPALDLVACQTELERDGRFQYCQAPHASFSANLLGFNRICHQAVLYRARVFERLGPYRTDYKVAADYEHLLRAYLGGFHLKTMPCTLVVFEMAGRSDNPGIAFADFKRVQRDLAQMLPAWFRLANEVIRPLEHSRVAGLKFFARSPLAWVLRPLWHAFKRR